MENIKFGALRGKIVEKYGNMAEFSRALGKDRRTVSAKLNGRVGFTTKDLAAWSKMLDIPVDDWGRYFFAPGIKETLIDAK